MDCKSIELEQGWGYMQSEVKKLKNILEGSSEQFSSEEYMTLYTCGSRSLLLNFFFCL
uniref:Uncharacterized protein MANES_01G073200 n=1 Tax=Rhizophora mucronata TaxID=61149 RepID=A0A2P2KIG3_RHIMU